MVTKRQCLFLLILQPCISEDFIHSNKLKVLATLEEQRIGPELRVQDFDDYIDLINGNAQEYVEQFLIDPHDFDGDEIPDIKFFFQLEN